MATQSSITTFTFVEQSVRTVMIGDEPWFVAADVSAVLDIVNNRRALDRLDDDEKGVHTMNTPGGNQQLRIINESGLYSLILTSRKPEAKRFKKWVTSEVLPALRRTGRYEIPQSVPIVPLLTPTQRANINRAAERLAWPFYMKNSTRLWFLKYGREFAGVNRLDHIPAARVDDTIEFLMSHVCYIDAYMHERVRHERTWLTQTLQRSLDQRLGRSGPAFELDD